MNEPALVVDLPNAVKVAYAEFGETVADVTELAALAGVGTEVVERVFNTPSKLDELEAFAKAYRKQNKHQPARVRQMLNQSLDVIQAQLDGADIDLGTVVLEFIKPLLRLTEIAEKSRLAESGSDATSKHPVLHITIGGVRAGAATPPVAAQGLEVIDVIAKELP